MSWEPRGPLCPCSLPRLPASPDSPPGACSSIQKTMELGEEQEGAACSAGGSSRGPESQEPRAEGHWGRSHDPEAVSHMTTGSPSHQPLLPSSQAPPWAQELPGTAAVTRPGLQGRGGHHGLPRTLLQVPPWSLPTSQLPLRPHPALGLPGLMQAHNPRLSFRLWHALLTRFRAYADV